MTALDPIRELQTRVNRAVLGQERVVERLIVALCANGNVLMEGLPGLAKTRAIKTMASHLEGEFARIQFTPDLLPSDVTGSEIYREQTGTFEFQQGPIFGNLVLADEINRAPAKVQAALLEAMEEQHVTVAGKTYALPQPFLVLATQNPIEQEGTYPLPEAQMDRFLLHVRIDQPSPETELGILRLIREESAPDRSDAPEQRIPAQAVFDARREIHAVENSEVIDRYLVDLIEATRHPERYGDDLQDAIRVGASPRGTLALDKASRTLAWLNGRDHVLPDDVRAIAHDCLRHRLILGYEARADGKTADDLLDVLLERVAVG